MTNDELTARDECRRCVYMLAFKADGLDRVASHELCGTVANALLHHHDALLSDDERESIARWVMGETNNLTVAFWARIALKL